MKINEKYSNKLYQLSVDTFVRKIFPTSFRFLFSSFAHDHPLVLLDDHEQKKFSSMYASKKMKIEILLPESQHCSITVLRLIYFI